MMTDHDRRAILFILSDVQSARDQRSLHSSLRLEISRSVRLSLIYEQDGIHLMDLRWSCKYGYHPDCHMADGLD